MGSAGPRVKFELIFLVENLTKKMGRLARPSLYQVEVIVLLQLIPVQRRAVAVFKRVRDFPRACAESVGNGDRAPRRNAQGIGVKVTALVAGQVVQDAGHHGLLPPCF